MDALSEIIQDEYATELKKRKNGKSTDYRLKSLETSYDQAHQ